MAAPFCRIEADGTLVFSVPSRSRPIAHVVRFGAHAMCDCEDFQYRRGKSGTPCTHIQHVLHSAFDLDSGMRPNALSADDLINFRRIVCEKRLACTDCCGICLTDFDLSSTDAATARRCDNCGKYTHRECWEEYCQHKGRAECPMCRARVELDEIRQTQELVSPTSSTHPTFLPGLSQAEAEAASQSLPQTPFAAHPNGDPAREVAIRYCDALSRLPYVCDVGHSLRLEDGEYVRGSSVVSVDVEVGRVRDVEELIRREFGALSIEGVDVQVLEYVELAHQTTYPPASPTATAEAEHSLCEASLSFYSQGTTASRHRSPSPPPFAQPLDTNHIVCDSAERPNATRLGGFMLRKGLDHAGRVFVVAPRHGLENADVLFDASVVVPGPLIARVAEHHPKLDAMLVRLQRHVEAVLRGYAGPPDVPPKETPVYFRGAKTPSAAGRVVKESLRTFEVMVRRDTQLDTRDVSVPYTVNGDCGCYWWLDCSASAVPVGYHVRGDTQALAAFLPLRHPFADWNLCWPSP